MIDQHAAAMARAEGLRNSVKDKALLQVQELNLPIVIDLPKETAFLGDKVALRFAQIKRRVTHRYKEHSSGFFAFAVKMYWFACWDAAHMIAEALKLGAIEDDEFTRALTTAEGHAAQEGRAFTLYSKLSMLDIGATMKLLSNGTSLQDQSLDAKDILNAMACHWFLEADSQMGQGNISEALGVLDEAYEALEFEHSLDMWDAVKEARSDGVSLNEADAAKVHAIFLSRNGQRGAEKRHEPMIRLREWTIEKYLEGTWSSASKAANDLKDSVLNHGRTINANLTPSNAQRTIETWIRRNKNNTA